MAYDKDWARKVLHNFLISCTRARNIVLCLQQVTKERTLKEIMIYEIHDVLIYSIQHKERQKLWRIFKTLCKKSIWDNTLLYDTCKELWILWDEVDVEKMQRQLPWD